MMRSLTKKIRYGVVGKVRKILSDLKLTLLTEPRYKSILSQRSIAVRELVDQADIQFHDGLIGVVFSKDRAFQLDALLESYFEKVHNPANLIILYKATDLTHKKAYEEVIERFYTQSPAIRYIEELGNFRDCLLRVLSSIRAKSIFFLVDDIVFINTIDLSIYSKVDSRSSILSLRLSPHLKKSYATGRSQSPPNLSPAAISSELLEFKWFEQGCEWSDPWSVDGNIYSTAEINVLSRISQFDAPNSYEDALKSFADLAVDRIGYCFAQSKILNLAINRVQNEINNQSGEITPQFLLEQWNKGLKMDRSMFDSYTPISPHEEHVIQFRSRT